MIGEVIGNFRVVARLGAGGMGEVFLAEQTSIHTRVAIKVLHAQVSTERSHVQRFFSEAVAAGRIKHAGIAKIFDVGFHGERAYLIMELLEGETLAARIRRLGRLGLRAVCDVGRQLASVLDATHAAGIVHRDLKPDNVFLVGDAELASRERVKVLDFGIAKLGTSTTISQTAGSMGTPAYMAPEQWASSSQVDGRADIYSLGCLLFEACTGRPPFVAASMAEACTMHLTQEPPLLRTLAPTLPGELDQLIARALAKDPAHRPSLADLADALAALAATAPTYELAAEPPARRSQQPLLATQATESAIPYAPGTTTTTLGGAASSHHVPVTRGRPAVHGHRARAVVGIVAAVGIGGIGGWRVMRSGSHGTADRVHNPFVEIDPPPHALALGVAASAPASERGFRPGVAFAPTSPYAIQEHEVTWSELEPYLAQEHVAVAYPAWALDPETRGRLPATNVSWDVARAYCKAIGGALPTEEQWEYAARGAELRAASWTGTPRVDRAETHTAAGSAGVPVDVDTSEQDVTPPNAKGQRIYDLVGNVQEWTEDLWRADRAGDDDAWAQAVSTQYRAVRGLPLRAAPTVASPAVPAAYREPRCTGSCPPDASANADAIGFRCAKLMQVGAGVPEASVQVAVRPSTSGEPGEGGGKGRVSGSQVSEKQTGGLDPGERGDVSKPVSGSVRLPARPHHTGVTNPGDTGPGDAPDAAELSRARHSIRGALEACRDSVAKAGISSGQQLAFVIAPDGTTHVQDASAHPQLEFCLAHVKPPLVFATSQRGATVEVAAP